MPLKLIRRDKSGAGMTATEVVGPIDRTNPGAPAPHQKLSFEVKKVTEIGSLGQSQSETRWVSKAEIEDGKLYMLTWVMSGKVGDEIEYFLDRQNLPDGARFKSIAKDKIPPAGAEMSLSDQTPAGLIWRNGIFFEG